MKKHLIRYYGLKRRPIYCSKNHSLLIALLILLLLNVISSKGQGANTAPVFDMGTYAGLSAGQAGPSRNISTLLKVSDTDRGQLLTWSIASPPTIGTLIGFSAFALSGKVGIIPDNTLRYQPTPGQTGTDEFIIKISDGTDSSTITINVSILWSEPPSNPGNIDEINQSDTSRGVTIVQKCTTLSVAFGTHFTDLQLPRSTGVTYANGEGEVLPIFWYASNFNGNVSGEYLLIGDLLLTPGSSNTTNKKAEITISVLANLPPTKIILSDSILAAWPFEDPEFPPNFFTTHDVDDDHHSYQLIDGIGDADNCKFTVSGGILIIKDLEYLKEQKTFYVRVKSTDSNNNSIEQNFTVIYVPKGGRDEDETVDVPNAFSPNGDGINDTWIVPELKNYKNIDIKVFDRSGVLMFHTINPAQGWDGRNPNGKIIAGVYYYRIQVDEINLKKQGVLVVLTN